MQVKRLICLAALAALGSACATMDDVADIADAPQARSAVAAVAADGVDDAADTAAATAVEVWRPLFDGESLTGWTAKIRGFPLGENYRDTFRAADGTIRVTYENYDDFGQRFGHLFYRTPFSAYRLRFEYRFVGEPLPDTPAWAHANSGVMIYSQDPVTMAVEQSFPVSVEAQLLGQAGAEPRFNGNMCSPGTHVVMKGTLVTEHCINASVPAAANGQWIAAEIEVAPSGDVIQRINGVEAIRYSQVQLDPEGGMANSRPLITAAGGRLDLDGGYIALQSEGHPIEFRKIEILELK